MLIVVHYCYRFLCTVVTDSCALLLLFSVHSIYHFLCTRRFCLQLHMPGMASWWRTLNETHQTDRLSFSDGLELLLQSELDSRRNNRIARLIRSANFKQHACIEELEASDARGIPAGAVSQLATGEYLKEGATIIISGPTGTGKSFLACALGEGACRLGYKVIL